MNKRPWNRPAGRNTAEIVLVLLSVVTVLCPRPVWSFNADDNEFNGITWGTKINEVKGMTLIRDSGEVKTYKKEPESLQIPGVKTEVGYSFYQGRFFKADILCSASVELLPARMKELIKKHRGKGEQGEVSELFMEETRMYTLIWEGTRVSISYIGSDYKGKLSFRYKPVRE